MQGCDGVERWRTGSAAAYGDEHRLPRRLSQKTKHLAGDAQRGAGLTGDRTRDRRLRGACFPINLGIDEMG